MVIAPISRTEISVESKVSAPDAVVGPAQPKRLDGLTSLRFFAAAMILLFHVAADFKFYETSFLRYAALWQGVTFFFVLSGFILTHVHPVLGSMSEVKKFLFARFARVWPTMSLTVLVCLLLHFHGEINAAGGWALVLLNIIGLQFGRSLNPPSWSISVEYIFYLCFPALLISLEKKWSQRLLLGLALALCSVAAEIILQYQHGGTFAAIASPVIVVNPLCRLFEFILGMTVAVAYRRYAQHYNPSLVAATLVEIAAILAVVAALVLPLNAHLPSTLSFLEPFRVWLYFGGVAPIYGLLILITACEKGLISKLLTARPFVALGELSFSLYMFHAIVLTWFVSRHEVYFHDWTTWQKAGCVSVLSLLVARLNCKLVEVPCRNLLTRLRREGVRVSSVLSAARHEWQPRSMPVPALVLTSALIGLLWFCTGGGKSPFRNLSTGALRELVSKPGYHPANVLFGNQFWLKAIRQVVDDKGLHISLIWQATQEQSLTYTNSIDAIDRNGQVLLHKRYFQDEDSRFVKSGKVWQDQLDFSANELDKAKIERIAVSILDSDGKPLFVQNGDRDEHGQKSIIKVAN